MKIAVVSMRGEARGGGLVAEFDASGGSIGRATTNLLVLDDPDRTVSRVHAQVLSRNGVFFIIDRGSNPLSHNGRSLGLGNEAPLANGDRLQIGSFELAVSHADSKGNGSLLDDLPTGAAGLASATPGNVDDPFADLMVGLAPAPGGIGVTPGGIGVRSCLLPATRISFPGEASADPRNTAHVTRSCLQYPARSSAPILHRQPLKRCRLNSCSRPYLLG